MVVDTPCACSQRNLQTGVAVQKNDDGDEVLLWKGKVGECFVRFVETVRFGHLLLMVLQFLELCKGKSWLIFFRTVRLGVFEINLLRTFGLGFGNLMFRLERTVSFRIVVLRIEKDTSLMTRQMRIFEICRDSFRNTLLL